MKKKTHYGTARRMVQIVAGESAMTLGMDLRLLLNKKIRGGPKQGIADFLTSHDKGRAGKGGGKGCSWWKKNRRRERRFSQRGKEEKFYRIEDPKSIDLGSRGMGLGGGSGIVTFE